MNNNKIQLKIEHFENSKTVSNFCLMYTGNHIEKERERQSESESKNEAAPAGDDLAKMCWMKIHKGVAHKELNRNWNRSQHSSFNRSHKCIKEE